MRPGTHVLVEEKNDIERINSLDGLRELATLAVVAYHYTGGALHWLLPGGQFVTLFFILSGLVLSIAPLRVRTGSYDWPRYQPRRVVRLAIPTCAAVGLCCAVFSIFSWNAPRPCAGKIERRRPHPPWRMGPSSFTGNHHQTSPPGAVEQEPVIGPVQLDVGGI
jgi:hypothetical protein